AQSATVHAAVLAHHCLTRPAAAPGPSSGADTPAGPALHAGVAALPSAGRPVTGDEHDRLVTVLRYAQEHPADRSRLARLAPDATAPSALLGG
ncbi:hypothetical protein GTY54_28500, partial [Streptomyces sp. SID625]|nr:hypothetical protein [Streptomyces sp. SID625]